MRVHDSQAYTEMDVISECISRILELREILLSFQTGFNLVNATVGCAILESKYLRLGTHGGLKSLPFLQLRLSSQPSTGHRWFESRPA